MLKFDAYQNLERLRKPVDKDKWGTEPAVVNAFYNPNKNHIGKYNSYIFSCHNICKCMINNM